MAGLGKVSAMLRLPLFPIIYSEPCSIQAPYRGSTEGMHCTGSAPHRDPLPSLAAIREKGYPEKIIPHLPRMWRQSSDGRLRKGKLRSHASAEKCLSRHDVPARGSLRRMRVAPCGEWTAAVMVVTACEGAWEGKSEAAPGPAFTPGA
jgi:hypothetical protein